MRVYLAPMEGVVDHHLRRVYAQLGGIDLCVTEFIRVTQTRLPDKVFHRYCPELQQPIAVPVRVQLLGSDPTTLAVNAREQRAWAPAESISILVAPPKPLIKIAVEPAYSKSPSYFLT